MARWDVHQDYRSFRDGTRYALTAGQVADLSVEEAEWVNRDSPGTLTPEKEKPKKAAKVEPEPVEQPEAEAQAETSGEEPEPERQRRPRNRQHRASQDRTA